MNDLGQDGTQKPTADRRLHPFEVFGDYVPNNGARVLIRIDSNPQARMALLASRATGSEQLDPTFAQAHIRAGLALVRSANVQFAWASTEGVVALLEEGAGAPAPIQNELVSMFSARLSLLLGDEVPAVGCIYELPDLSVVRRAFSVMLEDVEEATPHRSSLWLGAQLKGRGEAFHPSMIDTLEEQSHLLQSNGIDMDSLPGWWWRGMAAVRDSDGALHVVDEVPSGDAFGALVQDE